jgi:hypothetical protein
MPIEPCQCNYCSTTCGAERIKQNHRFCTG